MDMVITIFNVISLVILALMLLKGYFSGLWKSLVSLGILILGIIVVGFCVNPVGNAIANPENVGALQEFINEQLGAENATMDPNLADLTLGLAAMIVKMTVLFAGMSFVICVVEPILSLIINLIFFRRKKEVTVEETSEENTSNEKKKRKNNKKPIWVRLGGVGVKAVHFFVIMIALFIPVFAVNSLVLTYEDTIVEQENVTEDTVGVFKFLNDIDNVFIKKPVNAANKIFKTNIEVKILSSLSDIKIGDHKINLINEVGNLEPLVNIILKNIDNENAAKDILIEGKEDLAKYIRESVLLETMYPLIIDFIELNKGFTNDSIVTYKDLISIDFGNDKNSIANIIIIIGDYLEKGNVNFDDMSSILSDEELPVLLKSIGDELSNTTFMKVIMKVAQNILEEAAQENKDLSDIVELIDLTKITNEKVSNDLYYIGILLNKIEDLGILNDTEVEFFEEIDIVEEMIKVALKLSIFENSEEKFIVYMFESLNILEGYDIDINEFDFDTVVSWDAEIHALFNIIREYTDEYGGLSFNVEDLKEISGLIKGPNGEPCYFTNYIIGCILQAELEKVVSDDILDEIEGKYDITDPEDFEELTGSLGAAIEVGMSIEKMEDVQNLSSEEITEICDTIAELDNHKSELLYDLVVGLTTSEGIVIDVTEEEFMSASLTKEAEVLEEILIAITNDVSEEDIDALLAEAEEETIIIKAFIEQYIK